jgi:hypothetical protein
MPAPLPIDTERDGLVSAQLLALANVLDGLPRAACRDDRADVGRGQTLGDWVHRCNAEGLAGLRERPHPGSMPRGARHRLTPEQLAELAWIVEDETDPEQDDVVR